ncbi:MAG: Oligopeptidase A [Chlamydiia bacterium]|nr:Oligopeptidase A [Chlamydiia bacterium]
MNRFYQVTACAFLALASCAFAGKIDRFAYENVASVPAIQKMYFTSTSEILKYKEDALANYKARLQSFLEIHPKKRTIDNTLQQFDVIEAGIAEAIQIMHTFAMVEKDNKLRETYLNSGLELNKAYIESRNEHRELYTIMSDFQKRMKKRKSFKKRHDYMLSEVLLDMKKGGFHLPEEQGTNVKMLTKELITLQQSFAKNIREDHSNVKATKDQLATLPESFVSQLDQDEKGNYLLTCDYPTYFTVMKSCDSEDIRRDLYRAFNNRAYPANIEVLHKIIRKRDHLAKELGYESFAHFQLSSEMVKKPEKAQEFLSQLSAKSLTKEKEEALQLKKILGVSEEESKLKPWNVLYAREKYKSQVYSFNDNVVKEYFPLESTVSGLMDIYERFFDLEIKEVPVSSLWHEDVRLIQIKEKDAKNVSGYILMDLHPRKNKYSHACSCPMYMGLAFPDGSMRPTINLLIMNFPKATEDRPSLMTLDQARTFFHEFGHGIHAVLGKTEYVCTSGYNVKTDFVELPSQILEEWLKDKDILKMVSSHYKTGKPLPDELVEKIVASRKMDSGNFVVRQCLLSHLSLECFLNGDDKDTISLYKEIYEKSGSSFAFDMKSHQQASFGHLDGYGARYYGYLWSRVFALDVFAEIKKEGLLNPKAGKRYIKEIIGKGGSEDPEVLLRNYLGRDPELGAFLEAYGIN